jgi:chromosome segregation ATPase
MDAASELRRLTGVEAELQQAREERTALLVNEQNLTEELALVNEMNDQLREQNTAVDAACAKYEQELAALRASLGEPVGSLLVGVEFGEELGDYDIEMNDASCEAINEREAAIGCEATYALFAIKDTK